MSPSCSWDDTLFPPSRGVGCTVGMYPNRTGGGHIISHLLVHLLFCPSPPFYLRCPPTGYRRSWRRSVWTRRRIVPRAPRGTTCTSGFANFAPSPPPVLAPSVFSDMDHTPPMKCLWFCRARPPCLTAFPRYKYRLATGGYSITQLHGGGIVLLSTPKRHNERGGGGNCTPLHYPLGSPLPCAHCYCKLSPRRCASSRRGVCGRLHTLRNVPVHLMLRSFVGRFITTLTPFFPTRLSPPYHYHCTSLPMHT